MSPRQLQNKLAKAGGNLKLNLNQSTSQADSQYLINKREANSAIITPERHHSPIRLV